MFSTIPLCISVVYCKWQELKAVNPRRQVRNSPDPNFRVLNLIKFRHARITCKYGENKENKTGIHRCELIKKRTPCTNIIPLFTFLIKSNLIRFWTMNHYMKGGNCQKWKELLEKGLLALPPLISVCSRKWKSVIVLIESRNEDLMWNNGSCQNFHSGNSWPSEYSTFPSTSLVVSGVNRKSLWNSRIHIRLSLIYCPTFSNSVYSQIWKV